MFPAIPPPPFLQCPGVPPVPWKTWRRVLQVYVDAAAPDATPDRKKALLLNALGVEGFHAYYKAADEQTLLDGVQASGDGATCDAYQQALAILDAYFAPPEDAVCVRARFHRRIQEPDENAVQFILALRHLANHCNFGTAADTIIHEQILHGLRDPNLLRSFIQMGGRFHCPDSVGTCQESGACRPRVAAASCSAAVHTSVVPASSVLPAAAPAPAVLPPTVDAFREIRTVLRLPEEHSADRASRVPRVSSLSACCRSDSAGRVCANSARSRSLHGLGIGGAEPFPIGAASLPACSGPYCAEGALERKFMGRFSRSTGLLWAATVQTPFVELAPIQASAPYTQT
ncbi:hypothetical protein MTO96_045755 [Rhipicephalus appendiculatus]